MAQSRTRRRTTTTSRRAQDDAPPRITKSIRQAAELWVDFFNLAMDKLIEESRGATANRECVKMAGELADEALEVYEKRWPGVFL